MTRRLVLGAGAGVLLAGAVGGVAGDAAQVAHAAGSRAPSRLLVTAAEFRFGLSRASLSPGPAIVQLANRGQDAHDLVLRRLDRRGRRTGPARALPVTQPGVVSTRVLGLTPGRYVLFCSVRGHRALGMQGRITVGR